MLRMKLTSKVIDAGKGSTRGRAHTAYTVPLSKQQCEDARDALSKVKSLRL